jgi:hypothetical protein
MKRRATVVGPPNHTGARIDDWNPVGMRGIDAVVIRVSAVGLPAIGDFGDT